MDATVVAAAQAMWPGSDVVDAGEARGTTLPVRARFAILPHGREPRVLVPLDPPHARAASVRHLHSAAGGGCSVAGLLATAAMRVAPGMVARDRVVVRGGAEGLDTLLSEMLGTSVTFAIDLGSRELSRGPVLQVFDPNGRTVAFARLGTTPEGLRAIRDETHALATLAEHRFATMRVPRVLATGSWQEWPLLTLEPLPVPAWRASGPWDPPEEAMDELGSAFPSSEAPLELSRWWQRQWEATASADPVVRGRLGRCLERVAQLADQQAVAWGAAHGAWTPWCMARRHRQVMVWNWANFETDAPRGLDRLHFLASVARARHGNDPDALLIALRESDRGTSEEGSPAQLRCLLYLVAMATRCVSLLREDSPDHVTMHAEATVVALEKLSGEVTEKH